MTESNLSHLQPFNPERCLGVISHVSTASVDVAFDSTKASGHSPLSTKVGDYVVIESSKFAIVGQILDIRLPERGVPGAENFQIASVNMLTTLETDTGRVTPGVLSRPRPGDRAYLAHSELIQQIAEARNSFIGVKEDVTLSFAQLLDSAQTPLAFSPEMMVGRHCAILGTTGSGKSWSVARLVEQCARHRSKVIVFDATGEFGSLGGPVLHVYLGNHPNPDAEMRQVVLPYYQLTENDLFAIFKPTGQSQGPKLRQAIKTLKLLKLAPGLGLDGTVIKANKSKENFDAEYARHIDAIEDPQADFDVSKLVRQIQAECVFPTRSAFETQYWGDINGGEHSQVIPMVNRVSDIIQSTNLAPIFDPQDKPSVLDVIDRFLEHPTIRVLCVSLQYLSFAHNAREIVANAMGRYLMQLARNERFKKQPLVALVDEAHQFLNINLEENAGGYPLDSFAIIAKEGRKYALNICIATQRPRDIPESVLSQMGTLVVHRLINDRDRSVVERASGSMDRSSLSSLPALAPGQAVILGVDFPVPVLARIERPTNPPRSEGPNYQRDWKVS